jgi:HK97 family phage major capsid protein
VSPITEVPGGFGHGITHEKWAKCVLTHLYFQSVVLASGATRIDTVFRAVHVPRVTGDRTAGWYGEVEVLTAGEPVGNELLLQPKKCAAITTLSQEVVADSQPSVIDAVGTAMTRAVALKADAGISIGAGGKEPTGVYLTANAGDLARRFDSISREKANGAG